MFSWHTKCHLPTISRDPIPRELVFRASIRNTSWVTFQGKINFATADFDRTQHQTDIHSILKSQFTAENGQRRRIYREPPVLAKRLTLLASPPLFSCGFLSAAASSLSRLKTACLSPTNYAFARQTDMGTCQTYHFRTFNGLPFAVVVCNSWISAESSVIEVTSVDSAAAAPSCDSPKEI